uniref:Uncharacterized protein n=1 Tax=Romanomermis culicivorax TaxID=13658 RepID=A0A915HNH3_ROMCU
MGWSGHRGPSIKSLVKLAVEKIRTRYGQARAESSIKHQHTNNNFTICRSPKRIAFIGQSIKFSDKDDDDEDESLSEDEEELSLEDEEELSLEDEDELSLEDEEELLLSDEEDDFLLILLLLLLDELLSL